MRSLISKRVVKIGLARLLHKETMSGADALTFSLQRVPLTQGPVKDNAGADSSENENAKLSDGEYRTVLAAQRTLLAFLRTALAVLVVFRDNAFGPILASLVAAMGIFQFATAVPLYMVPAWREGARVNAKLLFKWTQAHSLLVCALVVVTVSIAIPWRFNREISDVNAESNTDIEVFD